MGFFVNNVSMTNNLVTKIYVNNGYRNVNPEHSPVSNRVLRSFLIYNNAPDCFVKTSNKWYKMSKNGRLTFVCRTLNDLSLKEWLEEALK